MNGNTRQQSLQENYGGGAFGAALGFGTRQALVMVDFAQAYFEPDSPLFANRPEVLGVAAELLVRPEPEPFAVPVFPPRAGHRELPVE